jgi:nucleotide-binding universal stress UspA family protein
MDAGPILICYDGSDGARHAIEAAAGLLGGHPAVVLAVGPPLTGAESYAALGPMPPSFEELNEDQALDLAKAGAELARNAGFAAEARADVAAPTWEGVIQAADKIDAAVIVVGSRGLTGVKEALEGSVSHAVAEHAGRPVLIVPPAPSNAT